MSWMMTDDPVADEMAYQRDKEKKAMRRPLCAICDGVIWDESALHLGRFGGLNDVWICPECVSDQMEEIEE